MEHNMLALADCKEYLKKVKDLELSCYQQERLIQKLKQRSIEIQRDITQLKQIQGKPEPKKPLKLSATEDASISFLLALFGALIGAAAGGALRVLFMLLLIVGLPWKPYFVWGAIIGFSIVVLMWILGAATGKKDEERKLNDYHQQVECLHQEKETARLAASKKTTELTIVLPQRIAESQAIHQKTKETLQKYYAVGILHPKYRGLVPVCTIYEYLDTGRCFTLTGHGGAYNLYEEELFRNEVLGKLDDIIDRLDEISLNQALLRRELQQSNAQLARISQTLSNVEHNTMLTSYYSQITASNTTYLTWLESFNYDRQTKILREMNMI